jgi:branched-chain amino acid transport system substrate-binding protein
MILKRLLARAALLAAAASLVMATGATAQAPSGPPIKIGSSMAMTGGLGPNGKSALLAWKIWEEEVNAKGGLLGRPVKLIYYDDQSNPSTVPGIYTKLLDIDKVDLVVGGYATAMLAPAMPVIMQHKKTFIGLLGLAVNSEFHYPNYFVMIPSGPNPKPAFTEGFFEVAMAQNPKPKTVAIVAADQEFSRNASDGARQNAKRFGLKIVYDKTYPPSTTDYAPIVRAIQATNPDIVVVCSYPPDSVGIVRAVNEIGFKPKMIGGGMVGPQNSSMKAQLGPLLNGFVNYDFWLPVPKMQFPGVADLMKKYQARAAAEGVDPLGYYMAPQAYAQLQVLQQAIEATKSLKDDVLADYIRKSTFHTVLGDVKFGEGGEWAQSRVLQVQFQNVKGNSVDQFKDVKTQIVVSPKDYVSGNVIYPYEKAK